MSHFRIKKERLSKNKYSYTFLGIILFTKCRIENTSTAYLFKNIPIFSKTSNINDTTYSLFTIPFYKKKKYVSRKEYKNDREYKNDIEKKNMQLFTSLATKPPEIRKLYLQSDYDYCNHISSYINDIRKELKVNLPNDLEFIRVGRDNDGGYIMINSFDTQHPKIAYSFGIADDVSWDLDMANKGYDVFMYDHTIENLPCNNQHFHFFKHGLGYSSDSSELQPLEAFIQQNQHENMTNLVLKMDIEGAEWEFFNKVNDKTLGQFSQMVFEVHDLLNKKHYAEYLTAFRRINKTHQLVHVHANNVASFLTMNDMILPELLELTFIKRSPEIVFTPSTLTYPTSLDMPCIPSKSELFLGQWG